MVIWTMLGRLLKHVLGLRLVEVVGKSMEPTLKNGELVIVKKATIIRQSDIIFIAVFGKKLIKRVKKIKTLTEEQVDLCSLAEKEPYYVYLTGDNPNNSWDSRKFGYVSTQFILGKVVYKVSRRWPFFHKVH